jgi:hypothetical protein
LPLFQSAAAAAVEECQVEYHIVRLKNPKAELSMVELMASIKGQLQPMAALGSQLCSTVSFVFHALWPGQAEPDTVDWLLVRMTLVSNRVDV